jgi:hypothetical protein
MRVLIRLARRHDMTELWITTEPDNNASWRFCGLDGAEYVETITVPPYDSLCGRGDQVRPRYRHRFGDQG